MTCWRLSVDLHENEKLLGTTVLGEPPIFCGFYLQEPHQVLMVKSQEKSSALAEGEGKRKLFKTAQSILHNKGLLSRRKRFAQALSDLGEGQLPKSSSF